MHTDKEKASVLSVCISVHPWLILFCPGQPDADTRVCATSVLNCLSVYP